VVLKISRRKLRMSDGKINVRPRRREASRDVGEALLVERGLVDDPGARARVVGDHALEVERVRDLAMFGPQRT